MLKRLISIFVIVLASGCPSTTPASHGPQAIECTNREFHAVDLQTSMRPGVVRIEGKVAQGTVTGTGFVIRNDANGLLIATNNHVVQEGNSFDAILDGGMRLAQVAVVKVDAERDLALLKAPPLGGVQRVVVLATNAALAQPVAAMGYPYVAGEPEPSLTFEAGAITNAKTEIEGQDFITTNANINPGNSGGPVIDACGQAIGVVVAVHKKTARTGLIIPIAALRKLVASYDAPRESVESEITARVSQLQRAVDYKRGSEVAAMFSRSALSDRFAQKFSEFVTNQITTAEARVTLWLQQMAHQRKPIKVDGHVITTWDAVPQDQRAAVLAIALDETERAYVMLAAAIEEGTIDRETAMIAWLGTFIHEMFGESPSFKIDQVISKGDLAQSSVEVDAAGTRGFWILNWVYERGDWRIDTLQCARGC
jgi:S1-C subfamily serine protease